MSALKDLLFHRQEHRFTIPQIQESLNQLGLKFCGFEDPVIINSFKLINTDIDAPYDLDKWNEYEQANPSTFAGMYQFWCQKIPRMKKRYHNENFDTSAPSYGTR